MIRKLAEAASVAVHTFRLLAARATRAEGPVPADPRRILVVAYGAVGDTIFFLPVLEALRKAWPKAKLVYVADYYVGTDMLATSGLADEYWRFSSSDLWNGTGGARRELAAKIREGAFDVVVLGPGTPLRGIAPALLGIPVRAGHLRLVSSPNREWTGPGHLLWKLRRAITRQELERRLTINYPVWLSPGEHAVERNLGLVHALGVAAPPAAESRPMLAVSDVAREAARRAVPDAPGKRTLGLHLGPPGTNYAKLWPIERWARALKLVAERLPIRVVVVGGPEERERAKRFAEAFGGECVLLAGTCGMLETFAAIARCELFLSSDTGLSKAAMAQGVPTVSVWGPVERTGYGVVWEPAKHTEVVHPVPCAPCVVMGTAEEGPGVLNFTNCGHHDCLSRLEAPLVADAVLKRLGVS
ncbi:MAG: glycosyltransferase family 9 protein [Elusimicrobia bacterium]|nr:glycosyltransferase family 9 protein [Elusimicrobiota bacterium]